MTRRRRSLAFLSIACLFLLSGCALRMVRALPEEPAWKTLYWGLDTIGVEPVWAQSTGSRVRIAVLDTGTQLGHPDLAAVNVHEGVNFCASGTPPADHSGHGTRVNGVIAGARTGKNAIGVAWDAAILPYKVECPGGFSEAHARAAVDMALKLPASARPHIVHGSWPLLPAESGSAGAAIGQLIRQHPDVLFVFAAPSFVPDIPAYAAEKNVIIVTGSGRTDQAVPQFPKNKDRIPIAAPGVQIRTADLEIERLGTDNFSGPSAAAAFVTGCAALIKATYGSLSGEEIKTLILDHAAKVQGLAEVAKDGRRLDCGSAYARAEGVAAGRRPR